MRDTLAQNERNTAVQSMCFGASLRYSSSWLPLPWVSFKRDFWGLLLLGLGERPHQMSNRYAEPEGDLGLDTAGCIVSSIAFPGRILEEEQASH